MSFINKYISILSALLLINGSFSFAATNYQDQNYDGNYTLLNDKMNSNPAKKKSNVYNNRLQSLNDQIKSEQLPTVDDYDTWREYKEPMYSNVSCNKSAVSCNKSANYDDTEYNNDVTPLPMLEDTLSSKYDSSEYGDEEISKLPELDDQIIDPEALPTVDDIV